MQLITGQGHLPRLGEHERVEVGNELQAELVELLDLSLLGKQLHWSVVGPQFRSLHLQLDELVDSWRELADTVAERAIAIGAAVDGQARTVAADSPLAGFEPGAIDDATLVRELATRLAETAERTRERAERLAELDTASEDVLIEVIRTLEEQLWMVRAQIPYHHS
jgi:starvation-inducible DNA-binding protein